MYGAVATWIAGHIQVVQGTPHPDSWLTGIACLIGTCAGALAFACAVLVWERLAVDPRRAGLEKAFARLTLNSKLIVNQTYPASATPPSVLEKVCVDAFVAANGDTTISREDHIRADGQPVHYWKQQIRGEGIAKPIDFVEQLGLTIEDVSGSSSKSSVVYLVLENTPRSKEIAIFHLPKIEPAEPAARVVKTQFCWPGLSTMPKTNEEDWGWTLESKKDVLLFELTVRYDNAIGPVKCTVVSAQPVAAVLSAVKDAAGSGWKYTVPNSPGTFLHELKFRRTS